VAKIVLDGVAREVAVERSPNGVTIVVDGRRHAVREVMTLNGAFSFLINNVSYLAFVSSNATGTRISLKGHTYLRTDARVDTDMPASAADGVRDGRIQAPMPGGIIALHIKEGDHVTAGQPVIVLESMKMHNELTSPIEGVVRRVHTRVGEQVPFGHVLAEIGAEGGEEA
jgi:biotin carboxyl carrier protein